MPNPHPTALKSLGLKDFTVFFDAKLDFGSDFNVIVGENGTGKTHLLKVAYACIASLHSPLGTSRQTKGQLGAALGSKLTGVFKPESLGRLARRGQGRRKCNVAYSFENDERVEFSFSSVAKTDVVVSISTIQARLQKPAYLPTRELLTIYPGFVSLYETTHLPFEETWRDTCILLGAPLARGPRERKIRELLTPLESALGGAIELDKSGRFYLKTQSSGTMEMHLVAEGWRKLAMIARLIATGALLDNGYLFWDEPEANLNPRLIKSVARTILQVASNGVQVFIATHSLFLLRELEILRKEPEFSGLDGRCFGLHRDANGAVIVQQGVTTNDIGDIASLDEELLQADRYLESEL